MANTERSEPSRNWHANDADLSHKTGKHAAIMRIAQIFASFVPPLAGSLGLIGLFVLGVPATSWADDAPAPPANQKPDDTTKKPDDAAKKTDDDAAQDWNHHFQLTGIYQGYPAFHSPYQGPNSLSGNTQARETVSGTAYLGAHLPWEGGEIYFDPEFNQGFGVSRTEGVDGFVNGEAAKAGYNTPRLNVARLFVRQVFGFGGEQEKLDDDQNQLGESVDISRLTLTFGKLSANDIFDTNQYAHDPRVDFLNEALWESAAWDYPADQRGYTYGTAVELNQKNWALRLGAFLEPTMANGGDLEYRFWRSIGTVIELETRHQLWGQPGKIHYLFFANRAPMGNLAQATQLAQQTAQPADASLVAHPQWKIGFALNVEQGITEDLGSFARLSWNDGKTQGWAFNDIDRSAAIGLSLKGKSWNRPRDTVGVAGVASLLSSGGVEYFNNGGTGILTGDGKLNYAPESILEAYYAISITEPITLTFDYQFVANPAFNQDRGPVNLFAARIHTEF